jgi:hypothetical protein
LSSNEICSGATKIFEPVENDDCKLSSSCFQKSRDVVESFHQIYSVMDRQEYSLRAHLISSLLQRDFAKLTTIMKRLGYDIESEEQIARDYSEIWKHFEQLSIPAYFDVRNLRLNGVLFNGNFFFLKYRNFEGKERIIYPFFQVNLSEVSQVYDPQADVFYTPKERYGRLLLSDVLSFKEVQKVSESDHDYITALSSMVEDDIKSNIRRILRDANDTSHSPIELADVLTLNLFVNNSNDLRLAGFIIKGQSFGRVHLNDVAGQILQVSLSPVQVVFRVHIPSIDDRVARTFIEEFESKQRNYCIVDRNDLARLFMAYRIPKSKLE